MDDLRHGLYIYNIHIQTGVSSQLIPSAHHCAHVIPFIVSKIISILVLNLPDTILGKYPKKISP
jgi:hypothetical protein